MRYSYPVHESLLPAIKRLGIRVGECAIPIRHMGYLSKKDSGAKVALYRSLGERKIAEFPEYFMGYLELGKVYLHERELGDAADMFGRAIRLAPRCIDAHYFLALTLFRQGRGSECSQLLRLARRRFPGNTDIRQITDFVRLRAEAPPAGAYSESIEGRPTSL
jgi:tetratricopeptide (TPR) repeat protein